jgi:tetratricopeptide (TPR) repeat protein
MRRRHRGVDDDGLADELDVDDDFEEDAERFQSAMASALASSSALADDGPVSQGDVRGTVASRPSGWGEMILNWLWPKRRPTLAERGDPPPGEDPVRRILSVPRGPARLDTFEETLRDLPPGSHAHRGVALAFHRELVAMAEQANVDLSLLKRRVEACADALIAADESERAGELLSRIGKKHRAAELFVSAGAIEKLEEAHFDIEHAEGGDRWAARLAFEQFESRFIVGLRTQALDALREAVKKWPDNAIYREVLAGIEGRLPAPGVIELQSGGTTTRLTRRWPLIIGRGEDAALRLSSPLVSRAHAEIALVGNRPYARAVSDKGGIAYRGSEGPVELSGEDVLEVGGVPLDCRVNDAGVSIKPTHEEGRRCIGLLTTTWEHEGIRFGVDDRQQVVVRQQPGVTLNGDRLLHDTPLLIADELIAGGKHHKVVGPRASKAG